MTSRSRTAFFAAAVAGALALGSAPARASLDTVIGPRTTVENKPFADCSARAKAALQSTMQNAFEAGAGSGEWIGVGRIAAGADASSSAVIECHPTGTGYAASFTCAAEIPPSPDTAASLCNKLYAAFNAAPAAGGAK
jgi:hypothetical protein